MTGKVGIPDQIDPVLPWPGSAFFPVATDRWRASYAAPRATSCVTRSKRCRLSLNGATSKTAAKDFCKTPTPCDARDANLHTTTTFARNAVTNSNARTTTHRRVASGSRSIDSTRRQHRPHGVRHERHRRRGHASQSLLMRRLLTMATWAWTKKSLTTTGRVCVLARVPSTPTLSDGTACVVCLALDAAAPGSRWAAGTR